MIRKLVLFTTLIVILLSTKVNASEVPVNHVKNTIVQHSIAQGVDPAMALAIAKVESGYCNSKRSVHGAVGVFQLMPSTAARMGLNPYQLTDNIKGGILYYKMMYKMFGSAEMALAAYNAGPGYIKRHGTMPASTRRYVALIMSEYNKIKGTPNLATKYKCSTPAVAKAPAMKPADKVNPHPVAISTYSSVKPMTASVPRNISVQTNRLIVKQQDVKQTTETVKPKLQVSMQTETKPVS